MRLPLQTNETLSNFNEQTKDIIDTVNIIATNYTESLDNCIEEVSELLKYKDDLTLEQLNYYIATIPILLYSLSDKIQDLGISSDSAKMQKKEIFNKAYQEQIKGTVAYKTSIAQQSCQGEQMIEDIFIRVYKKCESKIDMATMLHSSLKKILQWRVSELEVTRTNIISSVNRF